MTPNGLFESARFFELLQKKGVESSDLVFKRLIIVFNLLVDVAYSWLDPRVRVTLASRQDHPGLSAAHRRRSWRYGASAATPGP